MKLFIALLVALLATCILAAYEEENGVLVLKTENFDSAINEFGNILVEFYAPWCGHCKKLAPEYEKAAAALAGADVKLAKVDATEHNDLAKQFDIRGFPTLKFFKNGKAGDYNGGRTEDEIVNWLNKKIGPAAATVSSVADLDNLKDNKEVFAIGVFEDVQGEAAKKFLDAASSDDDRTYAITSSEDVRAALGVTGDAVVVIKKFDDLRNDLTISADSTADAIAEFVAGNSTPLVQTFTAEASKKIFSSSINKHVLFFTDVKADYHDDVFAAYKEAAKEFKGRALFVNVPITEKRIADYFDISEDSLPKMVLANLGDESGIKKYPFNGDSTVASEIAAHVGAFFDGTLKPFLKSEEPEEADTTGPVTTLRGKSFNDLVINNDKDVLVKFYAPWCGHCKKLAPVWDELGENIKKASDDKIVIAKIDMTANEVDVPGVQVKGFPTIYFFKAGSKGEPVRYEQGREMNDFVNFLTDNAKNTLSHDEL